MKKIFIILILFSTFSLQAANYFVKPVAAGGNDSDNGSTDSLAIATITKVNTLTLVSGDTVFFKRGNTWDGVSLTVKAGVVYSAYGTGDKPIIKLRPLITNWNNPASWTKSGNNYYISFTISENNRVWIDNVEAKQSQTSSGTNSTNKIYLDDANSKLYIYSSTNPATTFSSIQSSGYPNVISAANIDNVSLINLDLRGGRRTINLRGCDNWLIDSCYVGLDASVSGLTAYAYAGVDSTCNNGIIRNCVFDSGDRFYDLFQALNTWEGIWLYYGCNNWQVYNNTVRNWGHIDIELSCLQSGFTTSNNKIHDNFITAPKIDYGTGIVIDGIAGTMLNNEVYNNIIYDVPVGVHINSEGTKFYNNIINKVNETPWRLGIGHGFESTGYGSCVPQNMEIYNNVFANCKSFGFRFGVGGVKRQGNRIINNIFYNCDSVYGYQMLINPDTSNLDNTYQNNLFYKSGVSKVINFKGIHYTVDEFNARNGTNGDTISNNIGTNPLFINPASGNFKLQEDSPAIDAGINVGLAYTGDAPDIGPFEYYEPDSAISPVVVLDSPYNTTSRGTTIYAYVASDGGGTVTERGIVWNTSANPTTSNNKQTAGTGLGVFRNILSKLLPNTTYYLRGYAINEAGTAYSNEIVINTTYSSNTWDKGRIIRSNGTVVKF